MTKDQSQQLKGVAILMMLFLHLFNTTERVAECTTYVNFFNGRPLVYVLARICGMCVPFFLFISGYGLAKSQRFDQHTLLRRLKRLYSHYWLVFFIFVPLGIFLAPSHYPGSIVECLLNFLSLTDSYNREWWFLLPYVLLVVLARWIVPFVRQRRPWQNTLVFSLLYGLSVCALSYKSSLGDSSYAMQRATQFFFVLPAFYAGVCCASNESLGAWYARPLHRPLLWILLLLFARCFTGASVVNVLFCVPFILLFSRLSLNATMQGMLRFMGHYSTFMWLTHTFFAYYLFHNTLYALRYPLLIYAALLLVSLVTAMLLERILNLILGLHKESERP